MAAAISDGNIGLFEIGEKEGKFFQAHEGEVSSVTFDPSGWKILSSGRDGKTLLWDIEISPPASKKFPESRKEILWAAFSPDGTRIASVGRDHLVHILKTSDGSEETAFIGHEDRVFRVIFSPDGKQVATVSMDATLRFWDLTTGKELFALRLPANSGHPIPLYDFDFRCDSESGGNCRIAVPLTKGRLVLYNLGWIYD